MPASHKKQAPHILSATGNGILKCYNMFPDSFGTLDDMTAYLKTVQRMGFNTVWLNPIQLTTSVSQRKPSKLTGVSERIAYSLYAMDDLDLIDPRFSVVKLDSYGMPKFSTKQRQMLMQMPDHELKKEFNIRSKAHLKTILSLNVAQIMARHDAIIAIYEQEKHENDMAKLYGDRSLYPEYKARGIVIEDTISCCISSKKKDLDGIFEKLKPLIIYFDTLALQRFTQTAKQLGLTPIFDLVLNHVGRDSPLCSKYPEWFKDDDVFPDVKKFIYGSSLYKVFNIIWKPYIKKYMALGFGGARIDAVAYLPPELRQLAYRYINSQMKDRGHSAIILEEMLFSRGDLTTLTHRLGDAGATHVTASAFYQKREWHGGLPYCITEEHDIKTQVVSQGTINFTGNHDHYSAAYSVLIDMAHEEIDKDAEYSEMIGTYNKKRKLTYSAEMRFIFSHIQDILSNIKKYPTGQLAKTFLRLLFDKFAVNMFAGSAGYYMLSGDEAALELPSLIGLRDNRAPMIPQLCHPALIDPSAETLACLSRLAIEHFINHSGDMRDIYTAYSRQPRVQARILAPYIEQLKFLINGKQDPFFSEFNSFVSSDRGAANSIDEGSQEFIPMPRNATNQWGGRGLLFGKQFQQFILESNLILDHLPKPTRQTHSDMFLLNEHITVTVRYTESGFAGQVHIIFINLDPEKFFSLGFTEFKNIATWVQKRCFPSENVGSAIPGFHDIWFSIMGGHPDRQKPIIHMNKGLVIDSAMSLQVVVGTKFTHKIESIDHRLFKPERISSQAMRSLSNTHSMLR